MMVKSPWILLALCSAVNAFVQVATAAPVVPSTTAMKGSLQQFAPEAAKLFGNMITPASIMAGAIMPLGFASQLDFKGDPANESKFAQILRKIFPVVCVASFVSHLLVVMFSSVTVNQLTENKPQVAESVWHLIQRDYAVEWAAVNGHFVMGLLGFMWLVATKAFFIGGQGAIGKSSFTLALSGMLSAVSIVNRGIARGGGAPGLRFGSSIVGLLQSYVVLFYKRSLSGISPMEWSAAALAIYSVFNASKFMLTTFKAKTD